MLVHALKWARKTNHTCQITAVSKIALECRTAYNQEAPINVGAKLSAGISAAILNRAFAGSRYILAILSAVIGQIASDLERCMR